MSKQGSPHPMMDVPDAIRMVLEVTAKTLIEKDIPPHEHEAVDTVSSNSPVSDLLDRILADDVLMSEPGYPPYRASIMDGYAIQSQQLNNNNNNNEWTHQVLGRVHAGPAAIKTTETETAEGLPSAVYVTTGARIPDTYDCVVPIEEIEESPDKLQIRITTEKASIEAGKWIRDVGCDIPAGSVVLPRAACIHPVSLGLLLQSGQASFKFVQPLRVGVLSTGNELLVSSETWANGNSGELIQTGQIPDVNKPILLSLLESFSKNCKPIDLGMERDDDIESMTSTIRNALETCDIIVTTGGISMGETDIVEDVLVKRLGGTLHFGRLNMKPGKPTTFVTIPTSGNNKRTCLVFALPGNPVSATVCAQLVVRPAVNMLLQYRSEGVPSSVEQMTQNTFVPPEIVATLTYNLKLDTERPEYHRVVLNSSTTLESHGKGLQVTAASTGVQRSSRLMSLRDAQGLLCLPQGTKEKPEAHAGEQYPVLLLDDRHQPIRLRDSLHLARKAPKKTRVAITQVSQDPTKYALRSENEITEQVQRALSGSKSGTVEVVSCQRFSILPNDLDVVIKGGHDVDIWVVACSGSFTYSLDISTGLRKRVGKIADAVALQVRRGASAQDGTAALFEPVVGYLQSENASQGGCILVALPTLGLEAGLGNVRGLLKHALNVARGKPHNHHH